MIRYHHHRVAFSVRANDGPLDRLTNSIRRRYARAHQSSSPSSRATFSESPSTSSPHRNHPGPPVQLSLSPHSPLPTTALGRTLAGCYIWATKEGGGAAGKGNYMDMVRPPRFLRVSANRNSGYATDDRMRRSVMEVSDP